MYSTSELDELFLILNSIKGFKLRQPQWSNTTLSLVVGDSVLLLIMYAITLWSTKTSKYLLCNNCIKPWMFTNNPVNSNSVTPKFFADFGSLLE